MQAPAGPNDSEQSSSLLGALQVLAATASNDQQLRDHYASTMAAAATATTTVATASTPNSYSLGGHRSGDNSSSEQYYHGASSEESVVSSSAESSTVVQDNRRRSAGHRDDGDRCKSDYSTNGSNHLEGNDHRKRQSSRSNDSSGDESASRNSCSGDDRKKKTELRKGKWTIEEEEYTTRVIHYFSSGLMTLPEGKTLRSYLAEKLNCDPMRITKKYAGASCLGKRIHHLCESPKFTRQQIEEAKIEIAVLERRFRLRLEHGLGVPLPPVSLEQEESNLNSTVILGGSIEIGVGGPAHNMGQVVHHHHALPIAQPHQTQHNQHSTTNQNQLTIDGCSNVVVGHHHQQQGQQHRHQSQQAPQPMVPIGMSHINQYAAYPFPQASNGTNASSHGSSPAAAPSTASQTQAMQQAQSQRSTTEATMAPPVAQSNLVNSQAQSALNTLAQNAQLAAAAYSNNGYASVPPSSTETSPAGSTLPQYNQHQNVQHSQHLQQQKHQLHQTVQQIQYQHQPHPHQQTTSAPASTPQAQAVQGQTPHTFWQQLVFNPQAAAAVAAAVAQQAQQQQQQQQSAVSAPVAPVNTEMNEKWAQTLLVQITAQLQALATLSPTTFRQIQPQLLQAFMSSVPQAQQPQVKQQVQAHSHVTQQPVPLTTFNSSSFVQGIQLANGSAPTVAANKPAVTSNVIANPTSSSNLSTPPAISIPAHPATNSSNISSHGLIPLIPPTVLPFSNASFGSVGVSSQANKQQQHHHSDVPRQQQNLTTKQVPQVSTKSGSISINGSSRPPKNITEAKDPVRDAITLLRQNHEDALRKARKEQESERLKLQNDMPQGHGAVLESKENVGGLHLRKRRKTSFEGSKRDTATSTSSNEGDTTTTATKLTSRSSSSLTNNSAVDFNGNGVNDSDAITNVGKKAKLSSHDTSGVNSSIMHNYNRGNYVAPLGTKTDTSSGSGCTTNPFDTEESTSSAERLSDEMKTGSGSSSNSSSDDDKEQEKRHSSGSVPRRQSDHKKLGPLKKRKQYKSANNGGITLRNLADHNVRMDALRDQKKR